MKKTIVFDLGGVLVVDGVYPMTKMLIKRFSLNPNEAKKFMIRNLNLMFEGKFSENLFWNKFKKKFKVEADNKKLAEELNNYYKINYKTKKLVSSLRKKGYKVGFLSNSVKEITRYLENNYRIASLFDFGIYSHVIKTRKPRKKIFRMALKKAKARANEVIFIDDNIKNVRGARAAGIKTIKFVSVAQTAKALRRLGIE